MYSDPVRRAIADEAETSAELIGIGATALGYANFTRRANYLQAFLALSSGFERTAKLALVIDAMVGGKAPPTMKDLKGRWGHGVWKLFRELDKIAPDLVGTRFTDSFDPIQKAIVDTLDDFARNVTRYYNFDLLAGDGTPNSDSPIASWYRDVTLPVLGLHCTARQQERDLSHAQMSSVLDSFTSVRRTAEDGSEINTVWDETLRLRALERARPWERTYTLRIAQKLAELMNVLGGRAMGSGLPVPYMNEFYALYLSGDEFFRTRKTWSIYRL